MKQFFQAVIVSVGIFVSGFAIAEGSPADLGTILGDILGGGRFAKRENAAIDQHFFASRAPIPYCTYFRSAVGTRIQHCGSSWGQAEYDLRAFNRFYGVQQSLTKEGFQTASSFEFLRLPLNEVVCLVYVEYFERGMARPVTRIGCRAHPKRTRTVETDDANYLAQVVRAIREEAELARTNIRNTGSTYGYGDGQTPGQW
jgi:hypothetical protein